MRTPPLALGLVLVGCQDRSTPMTAPGPAGPPGGVVATAPRDGAPGGPGADAHDPADAAVPAGAPAPPPEVSCSSRKRVAVLFAGNPMYRGEERPSPAGAGFRADPPIGWRGVAFAGEHVFTYTEQEIWAGTIASGTLRRIAGAPQPGKLSFRAGPCAAARFTFLDGLAVLPDGSLVTADFNANALVKITDPTGDACAVAYYAGTGEPVDGVIATDPPHQGDSDGTGAAARFRLPSKPVADAAGTVYVIDQGNGRLRKVEPDGAAGKVTTIPFEIPDVQWNGLAVHGAKLVVVGQTVGRAESIVVTVDPATGAHEILVHGGGERFPPAEAGTSLLLSAVASDGKRIFVAGAGRIWEIDAKGRARHLAGGYSPGELVDYPRRGYDPTAEHPALEVQLKHSLGDTRFAQYLTYHDGSLYWSARAYSEYVIRIACL